jgi:hypothetical protein
MGQKNRGSWCVEKNSVQDPNWCLGGCGLSGSSHETHPSSFWGLGRSFISGLSILVDFQFSFTESSWKGAKKSRCYSSEVLKL